ncbi:MAG: peptidoglycan-binding domain-containing protein [Bacteroidota bacterium]
MKAEEQKKKKNPVKAILIALGVTAATVGGFFTWNYFSKRKTTASGGEDLEQEPEKTVTPSLPSASSYTPSYTSTPKSDFPLKKGSRGEKVKQLQNSLIQKYGKTILPRYGADGDFGSEMQNALEKLGFPTVIDENTFSVLTAGASFNLTEVAGLIYKGVLQKNYADVLNALKKIRNIQDYSAVSEKFRLLNFSNKKTLVSAITDAFPSATQQDALRLEFLRMGLRYDSGNWSLSGNETNGLLITTTPTEVIDPKYKVKVRVPKDMVIGYYLKSKQGWTLFRTIEKNKKLIIKSDQVKFYA